MLSTMGGGGQKVVKNCPRGLWMAPKGSYFPKFLFELAFSIIKIKEKLEASLLIKISTGFTFVEIQKNTINTTCTKFFPI